jgi:hypothetical protein
MAEKIEQPHQPDEFTTMVVHKSLKGALELLFELVAGKHSGGVEIHFDCGVPRIGKFTVRRTLNEKLSPE